MGSKVLTSTSLPEIAVSLIVSTLKKTHPQLARDSGLLSREGRAGKLKKQQSRYKFDPLLFWAKTLFVTGCMQGHPRDLPSNTEHFTAHKGKLGK